jgi:hypothetical protein
MKLRMLWPVVLLFACAHRGLPPGASGSGRVILIAGGPDDGSHLAATGAGLNNPFAVALDRAGNLFITEEKGNDVRRVDGQGHISVYAGTGRKGDGGDGGPAAAALLNNPHHIAFAPGGPDDLIIADTLNARVRRVDPVTGAISTLIGSTKGFGGDGGPAAQAQLQNVFCLAYAGSDRLYLADLGNRRVRVVDLHTGVITTAAGNGQKGVPADGATAVDAPLLDPRAVAVDHHGNLYIVERSGHVLRVVDPQGKIRTVAGTGQIGNSGDGGPALAATFNGPKHLTVDNDDNVLIVDTENHAIRKYLPREGRVVRVAGTGVKGSAGVGGSPEALQLNRPHGVLVDAAGAIYIADSENQRVLRIER